MNVGKLGALSELGTFHFLEFAATRLTAKLLTPTSFVVGYRGSGKISSHVAFKTIWDITQFSTGAPPPLRLLKLGPQTPPGGRSASFIFITPPACAAAQKQGESAPRWMYSLYAVLVSLPRSPPSTLRDSRFHIPLTSPESPMTSYRYTPPGARGRLHLLRPLLCLRAPPH